MSEKLEKLRAMLEKEKERRIKLNNRINEFRKNGNETAIRILDSRNAIAAVSALCTISAER